MDRPTADDVLNDAAVELGIKKADITDPYGSTDQNMIMLCRLLKRVGRALVRAKDWSHLQYDHTFNTVGSTSSYALPSGFSKIIDGTVWNRTTKQKIIPVDAREWQELNARGLTGAPQYFRVVKNLFYLYPTPTAVQAIYYEYVNKLWVMPTGQTAPTTSEPTALTDTLWFDEALLVFGLKLAYLRAKQMDSSHAQDEFNQAWASVAGADGAARVLSLGRGNGFRLLDVDNIPDMGFGT